MEAYLQSEDYRRENASLINPRKSRNAKLREIETAKEEARVHVHRVLKEIPKPVFNIEPIPDDQLPVDTDNIDDLFEKRLGSYFSSCIVVISNEEKATNFDKDDEVIQMIDTKVTQSINQTADSNRDLQQTSQTVDFNKSIENGDEGVTSVIPVPKIDPKHVKHWVSLMYQEQNYQIPVIVDSKIDTYLPKFIEYSKRMLKILAVEKEIAHQVLDLKSTDEKLESELRHIYVTNLHKPNLYQLILTISKCFVYENIIDETRRTNKVFLPTVKIQPDALKDGCFMTSEETLGEQHVNNPSLERQIVGISTVYKYNLGFEQIQLLIKFIFNDKHKVKMEAKIKLLSSLNKATRSQLIKSPIKLLIYAIHESLLTRRELIEMLFFSGRRNDQNVAKTCPCCGQNVRRRNASLIHTKCSLISWVQKFGFVYSNGVLHPKYMYYIPPTVAQYALLQYEVWSFLLSENPTQVVT